jgi:hypothetical protein
MMGTNTDQKIGKGSEQSSSPYRNSTYHNSSINKEAKNFDSVTSDYSQGSIPRARDFKNVKNLDLLLQTKDPKKLNSLANTSEKPRIPKSPYKQLDAEPINMNGSNKYVLPNKFNNTLSITNNLSSIPTSIHSISNIRQSAEHVKSAKTPSPYGPTSVKQVNLNSSIHCEEYYDSTYHLAHNTSNNQHRTKSSVDHDSSGSVSAKFSKPIYEVYESDNSKDQQLPTDYSGTGEGFYGRRYPGNPRVIESPKTQVDTTKSNGYARNQRCATFEGFPTTNNHSSSIKRINGDRSVGSSGGYIPTPGPKDIFSTKFNKRDVSRDSHDDYYSSIPRNRIDEEYGSSYISGDSKGSYPINP